MTHSAPEHRINRDVPQVQSAQVFDPRRRDGFDVSPAPRTTLDQMMAMEMA